MLSGCQGDRKKARSFTVFAQLVGARRSVSNQNTSPAYRIAQIIQPQTIIQQRLTNRVIRFLADGCVEMFVSLHESFKKHSHLSSIVPCQTVNLRGGRTCTSDRTFCCSS